ncbi:hypothetical protein D9M72_332270 [compost metagenome]
MGFERLVQQGFDLLRVANRGHASDFLPCVLQDELGGGPADLARAQLFGDLADVYPGGAAGQDEQRDAVDVEHQAVGDSRDVAAQRGGGSCRRRDL